MEITLVNHSCILYETDNIRLICDPWLEGRVFDKGWDLIVPSSIGFSDFSNITHIWFSHEHPDHFFPPNLNKISEADRGNITVLFQETIDKRVVDYCAKKGFKKVIELKPDEWYTIDTNMELMCENYTEGDSWLALRSGGKVILNTNDCEVNNEHDAIRIKEKVGGKVDTLLAQFSYACWAGNPDQVDVRRRMAKSKLDIFLFQINQFNPQHSIPIASYVWFCHEDNYYLNDSINKPDVVLEGMKAHTETKAVLLFPGETFSGEEHDNKLSLNLWMEAYARIENINSVSLEKAASVEVDELVNISSKFVTQLKSDFGLVSKVLKPSFIHLKDHGNSFSLSLKNGLSKVDLDKEDCDVILTSDSLALCMKFPWGSDTLGVNGRFLKTKNGNYSRFYNFFRYNQLKSRGENVNLSYLAKVAFRKAFGKNKEVSFYN